MKVMIVGAGGQLGRALQAQLNNEAIAFTHADLDITKFDRVARTMTTVEPDVLINAAAFNDVDGAESKLTEAFELNAKGPKNLAMVSRAHGVKLVHVSTDYVFDGYAKEPYDELSVPNPLSAYGASKLAGEREVANYQSQHYIVRTAWLYHTEGRNFPKTMLSLAGRDSVNVVSDRFGCPTFAPHLAAAILKVVKTDLFGLHHMAGQGQASWYDLTKELYQAAGIQTQVNPVPATQFQQAATRPDYSVLTTLRPDEFKLPHWKIGLQEFVQQMRVNEQTLEGGEEN
jgi:dTDP-4-dehydrorhamnose reductase